MTPTEDASKNMLLTGAGFTHNIGTPLAEGMWERIHNHSRIQQTESIKRLMSSDFDYEHVYHSVHSEEDKFSDDDRAAMDGALSDVFRNLDRIVRSFSSGGQVPAFNMAHFVRMMEDMIEGPGFMFTLNHDLFMERWYGSPITLPGVPNARLAEKADPVEFQMPSAAKVETAKSSTRVGLEYIKLHGSQNWRGRRGFIIGREKRSQRADEPLLEWYGEVFTSAVTRNGSQMLCIGYGFGDEHIVGSQELPQLRLGRALSMPHPRDRWIKIRQTDLSLSVRA